MKLKGVLLLHPLPNWWVHWRNRPWRDGMLAGGVQWKVVIWPALPLMHTDQRETWLWAIWFLRGSLSWTPAHLSENQKGTSRDLHKNLIFKNNLNEHKNISNWYRCMQVVLCITMISNYALPLRKCLCLTGIWRRGIGHWQNIHFNFPFLERMGTEEGAHKKNAKLQKQTLNVANP